MVLKDELAEKLLNELRVSFPHNKFYIENNANTDSKNCIVENSFGELYANGETNAVTIKSEIINSVGIIFTWNNVYENAYIVFIGYELGFVPYKIEIISKYEDQHKFIVKICKAADNRLKDYNSPSEQCFYDEKSLMDYLISAISKWFGCQEVQQ